jgi:hypothetical protein
MAKYFEKYMRVPIPVPTSVIFKVFGLRNELVHHLLTPHFFCLVCGMD